MAVRGVTFRMAVPCDLARVRPAVLKVREFLAEHGLREEEMHACELALVEACNNAIQHTDGAGREQPIELSIMCNGAKVELRVRDHTPGFKWPGRAQLPAPESERGRGLFLIQTFMDEAAYYRGEGQNVLLMFKTRQHQEDHHPPPGPGSFAEARSRLVGCEKQLANMARDLWFCTESLAAIFRSSAALGRHSGLADFAQGLLKDLLHITAADWFVLRAIPPGTRQLVAQAASDRLLQLIPLALSEPQLPLRSVEVEAAATGRDVWFDREHPLEKTDPLHAFKPGTVGMVRPFSFQGEALGTLAVGAKAGQLHFTAAQAGVVRTFTDFLAIQIATARMQEEQMSLRLMSHELNIARNIQRALLPKTLPPVAGFSQAGFCENAREVGGDFYDLVSLSADALLLIIADVMGKGIPAALFAASFRTLVRSMAGQAAHPGKVLSQMNRLLFDELSGVDMFITAQLAYVDTRKRCALVASAGHCPALLVLAKGSEARAISPDGMPLGILAQTRFEEEAVSLGEGARLLLYTDGVTEARDRTGLQFGQEKLARWLEATVRRRATAEELKQELAEELQRFQAGAGLRDDQTFLFLIKQ